MVAAFSTTMAQDASTLVKQVKEKLLRVEDYEAKGILKTDVSFMKIPESAITVYFKKPDKFRIRKQDGISVTPKGGVSINLGSLLAGDQYTTVAAGYTDFKGSRVAIVKLIPFQDNSEIVASTLYIDEKLALIRKATTTSKNNGTYEIEMVYGKFADWGLPDKVVFLFNTSEYKLPKGIAFDYDAGDKDKKPAPADDKKGKMEISYSQYRINKGIDPAVFSN